MRPNAHLKFNAIRAGSVLVFRWNPGMEWFPLCSGFPLLILTSFNYEYGPQNLPRRDQYQCLLETLQNFFIYWYTLILLVIVYNVHHNTATTKSVNLFPNSVELRVFLPWCNLWMINVAFHIFSSADQSKTFFNQIIKNVCLALMQPSKARCGLSYFKQNQSINQSMRARLSWECCIKTRLQNLLKNTTF